MDALLNFQMCGKLLMGIGASNELPDLLRRLGKTRPFLVTDKGIVQAGIFARIQGILEKAGLRAASFDRVEPDPSIETVAACLDAVRAASPDVLIGLGGGSSLDVAKVVSVLLTNGGDVSDYVGIDKIPMPGMDTVLIPTTAGTGSEVTPIAVLSDTREHLKKGIVSDRLYARAALVDPELTLSLPPRVTAYTGMDALTHAIEAFTNRHAHPFIDVFALESIRLIGQNLRTAVHNGADIRPRYNMSLASLFGGLCLGSVNTAGTHALAYPLGGTFGVPHGVANSLLLPYVMEFNLPADPARFSQIAVALGQDVGGLSPAEAAARSVRAVVKLSADIGIVSRMRDLGVPADAIDDMAAAALKVTRLLNNNPRTITLEDAKRIYRSAY